ncbi:MAG: hypothetical protein K6B41_09965 [Butyrivibrio sp.]|nr:hypothetical protein [Butyrivibrio sp.]
MFLAQKRNQKITKYPKTLNLNLGMIIFLVIIIYVVVSVLVYLSKTHMVGYRVLEGSLSSDNVYSGIALRTEEVVGATKAGYVNYFATEGGRVAVGDLVYTLDESGQLLEYLKSQGSEQATLSNEDLSELRTQIVDFTTSFNPKEFYTVYDFKSSLDGTAQKLANNSILNNIEALGNSESTVSGINYLTAVNTGIVVYSTDGYETKTWNDLTIEDYDQSNYTKNQLINNTLVESGDTVYKICTDENWSIVIQENDQDKVQELIDLGYVKVRFLKNQDESWGKVDTFTNDAGDTFVKLSFTNSMITFCKDRFLSVELITEEQSGLKIPNSAIAEKNFFIVPKDYIVTSEGDKGVLRVVYDEQGNESTEFVQTSIYNETEETFYLDDATLRAGDTLIKTDSSDRFTVSEKDTLIGVYNMNKGYAEFRQISILYQNDEYSIVKSNTTYGLSEYDFIVLDASTIDASTGKAKTEADSDNNTDNENTSSDTDNNVSEDGSSTEDAVDDSAEAVSDDSSVSTLESDNDNLEEVVTSTIGSSDDSAISESSEANNSSDISSDAGSLDTSSDEDDGEITSKESGLDEQNESSETDSGTSEEIISWEINQ